MSREQELETELSLILALLDWGSLDGPQFQAYWRCKALVGTPREQELAKRKLGSLWRCEDHSPRRKPFLGFSPYEGELRDGPKDKDK